MAQLHCYVPDSMAEQLRERAKQARMPVSKYLARMIAKEVANEWPEGYFEQFGAWQGEPLKRPPQGNYEKRADFG